jgi:branched-chain amino acid transport system substrate-binding protein
MKNRSTIAVSVLLLTAALTAVACDSGLSAADARAAHARRAPDEVALGAPWPWQARGRSMQYGEGLQMAVDEINGAGGLDRRTLKLVKYDDLETVDQGRIVAQQLASRPEVVAVIGHLESYVTIPAAAVYDQAGVLTIAPTATDPALTAQGYSRVFRSTFDDSVVGAAMARFAADHGHRRAAIYYMRNEYGRSLANAFESTASARGLTVVDRQSYDAEADLTTWTIDQVVSAWRTLGLDVVFIAGEAAQGAPVIAAMRRHGLTATVLGGDALGTPELLRGGPAVEGTIVASPFHTDNPRPEVTRFVAEFERRFKAKPDTAAALAYDAVQVFRHGAEAAHSIEPDRIAQALRAGATWVGVTGRFQFDAKGNLVPRPLVTTIVRHGRFEFLSEDATR